VLNPNDLFGSAANLLPLIATLGTDDFRYLLSHPDELPIPEYLGFDRDFTEQYFDALVVRWLSLETGNPTKEILAVSDGPGERGDGPRNLIHALVRVRPEAILEATDPNDLGGLFLSALESLAGHDTQAARRYAAPFLATAEPKIVDVAIAKGVAKSDPVSAVALARELNDAGVFKDALRAAEKIGPGVIRQVLEANDGKFSVTTELQNLALLHPELPWASFASSYESTGMTSGNAVEDARRLTAEERQARIARLDELPHSLKPEMTSIIASSWARTDPLAAVEWSLSRANPLRLADETNNAVARAFNEWLRSDPSAATQWAGTLPSSELRDGLQGQSAATLAWSGHLDDALKLFETITHPLPWTVESMAMTQARNDPASAAAWLNRFPDDVVTRSAVNRIMKEWFPQDATAAAEWVESQPAGTRRDEAVQVYAELAARKDPDAAGAWAAGITDAKLRHEAAELVFGQMTGENPVAAREWLRTTPGLDDRWRAALLRTPWR